MKTKLIALIFLPLCMTTSWAQTHLELEAGPAWQARNDVAIPSDTGTRFSLKGTTGVRHLAARFYAGYSWGERHEIRALIAPLTLRGEGYLYTPVSFQEKSFNVNIPVTATYKFNSYRASYRYRFISTETWSFKAGGTLKVRDAKIALEQEGQTAERTDLGVVPLLSFFVSYQICPQWLAELDADALAAKQGRAEDVSLKLRYWWQPERFSAALGYRFLEGGSDGGGKVYTFAAFHYLTASVSMQIN